MKNSMDYVTLTGIAERELRRMAEDAAAAVDEIDYEMCRDMANGIFQLWVALASSLDKDASFADHTRMYALTECLPPTRG
jgi:hypothetical protein